MEWSELVKQGQDQIECKERERETEEKERSGGMNDSYMVG